VIQTVSKPDPSKVNPGRAYSAYHQVDDRQSAYSKYIQLTFQATGQLAPGCDAKDLIAYYDANGFPVKSPPKKTAKPKPRR
jgi:hypothetical protein